MDAIPSTSETPSETYLKNIEVALLEDLSNPFAGNDVYKISSRKRGYCLIFDNSKFDDSRLDRPGSEVDSKSLQQVFQKLGFEVMLYPNLTKNNIESKLKAISKSNLILKQHDAFFAIFLSHGDENVIFGSNAKIQDSKINSDSKVLIEEIIKMFSNTKCTGLIGKPKIFIICTCRGNQYDNGVLVYEESSEEEDGGKDGYKRIPTFTDIIILRSTISGMVSMRDIQKGTWYVSSLVKAIADHAKDSDLESILKIVQNMVEEKEGASKNHRSIKQSTSYSVRGWKKKLYFNPGYPQ